jgi:hypothetical protein
MHVLAQRKLSKSGNAAAIANRCGCCVEATVGDIIAASSAANMEDTKMIIERPESAKQLVQRDPVLE